MRPTFDRLSYVRKQGAAVPAGTPGEISGAYGAAAPVKNMRFTRFSDPGEPNNIKRTAGGESGDAPRMQFRRGERKTGFGRYGKHTDREEKHGDKTF